MSNDFYPGQPGAEYLAKLNELYAVASALVGPAGPAGAPLNLRGTLANTGLLPASASPGDGYMIADHLWAWSGAWVDCGVFRGPKGDTGATGTQGPKGDTGAQGIQGVQGVKGDTGATGATGAQGIQGPKGDTGAQGPAGTGDVTGPASATDMHIAVFAGATGKVLKDGGSIPTLSSLGAQEALVSGTNIKTINGTSILGSGDISVSGGGGEAISSFLLMGA